jgi:hypothetical protein
MGAHLVPPILGPENDRSFGARFCADLHPISKPTPKHKSGWTKSLGQKTDGSRGGLQHGSTSCLCRGFGGRAKQCSVGTVTFQMRCYFLFWVSFVGRKQLSPGSFDILTPTRCGPCSSKNVPDGWSGLQISDDIVSDTKTCNMPWAAEPSRNHGRMLLLICFEGALEIIADLKEIFRSHTKVQAVSHVRNVVDGAGASGSRKHIDILTERCRHSHGN